nr:MAG TPA: hypothetical protein [Caudoviricetes sp.]
MKAFNHSPPLTKYKIHRLGTVRGTSFSHEAKISFFLKK